VDFLTSFLSKEFIVFFTAAVPVIEVRGSVPLGILAFKMEPSLVIFLSVIGSVIPVIPIMLGLDFITKKLHHIKFFANMIDWVFERTRKRSKMIEEFETIGLIAFIGIPLPGTGVWTGCVAAYLLGLPLLNTLIASLAGSLIASLIMTGTSLGILNFFKF
jgi:uncharacterized membrane protein